MRRDAHAAVFSAASALILGAVTAFCASAQEADRTMPQHNPSSIPEELTAFGDMLAFTADDGLHGREIVDVDRGARRPARGRYRSGSRRLHPGHAHPRRRHALLPRGNARTGPGIVVLGPRTR